MNLWPDRLLTPQLYLFWQPRIGNLAVGAADFADDRVLPAFSHEAAQLSINKMSTHYNNNCQEANIKKTVVLIIDPTGVIQYNDGEKWYTRTDTPARRFELFLNGSPLAFVDSFRYLGVLFHRFLIRVGDFLFLILRNQVYQKIV